MPDRKNAQYEPGELEVILSLLPTQANIKYLSKLLKRSEGAITIVYRIAYEKGTFGKNADIQVKKIIAAKKKVGIVVGPSELPKLSSD